MHSDTMTSVTQAVFLTKESAAVRRASRVQMCKVAVYQGILRLFRSEERMQQSMPVP